MFSFLKTMIKKASLGLFVALFSAFSFAADAAGGSMLSSDVTSSFTSGKSDLYTVIGLVLGCVVVVAVYKLIKRAF